MNIIWIVQENLRLNVTAARRFGELKVIFGQNQQVMTSSEEMVQQARHKLVNFKADDYLLFMGDPAAIAIVVGVLVKRGFNQLNVLKWDRIQADYFQVTLNFEKEKVDE